METATSYPNLNGPNPGQSQPYSRALIDQQGRLVRQDVKPMIMDEIGRCRIWHVKQKQWVFRWAPDVTEGVQAGLLSYTEGGGTPAEASADQVAEEAASGDLDDLTKPELLLRAEALDFKTDSRWGEGRLRNELHKEIIRRAEAAPTPDDLMGN